MLLRIPWISQSFARRPTRASAVVPTPTGHDGRLR
ncbi:hypothetical protein QF030_006316 [Streptomyces rishiriensis]|uniref:Uncharacterized protein n=1 Tax=Streptomyces rishiriensis TaxID=68264 RepID=A0ABU0NZL1_STRRH|nr:hypothetical protein [Streptomyces rishiriensis]